MVKALIYSLILSSNLWIDRGNAAADCGLLQTEASVTNSSGGMENGAVVITVTGASSAVKYFFCDDGGKVLNEEQTNSNKIDRLKKGTYYCIVSADKCSKKIKIIVD